MSEPPQRFSIQMVELVPAVPARGHQTGGRQHIQMLRYRLSARSELVPHGEPRAELEQCLSVAIGQFVEDRPTRGVGQRLEYITAHTHSIGK